MRFLSKFFVIKNKQIPRTVGEYCAQYVNTFAVMFGAWVACYCS